jgi:hypothetical protein
VEFLAHRFNITSSLLASIKPTGPKGLIKADVLKWLQKPTLAEYTLECSGRFPSNMKLDTTLIVKEMKEFQGLEIVNRLKSGIVYDEYTKHQLPQGKNAMLFINALDSINDGDLIDLLAGKQFIGFEGSWIVPSATQTNLIETLSPNSTVYSKVRLDLVVNSTVYSRQQSTDFLVKISRLLKRL